MRFNLKFPFFYTISNVVESYFSQSRFIDFLILSAANFYYSIYNWRKFFDAIVLFNFFGVIAVGTISMF